MGILLCGNIALHMVLQVSKVGNSLLITSYVMCGNSIFENGKHILHDLSLSYDLSIYLYIIVRSTSMY